MIEKYLCLNTYHSEYGVDFYSGQVYCYKNGYMESTENGTSVMIDEDELNKNWKKIN